jgi:type IV secretion system protein VirB10
MGGYSGLQEEVENHWKEQLEAAAPSTLPSVGAELGSGTDAVSNPAILQAPSIEAATSPNQTGQQVVRRNLNMQPTLTIRHGFPIRAIVTRDIIVKPYQG